MYDGGTPLHRAAEIGSMDCANILMENNADPNATDFNGETPFHTAAEYNQMEIGHFLKRHGSRDRC